ncbi:MAG: hypothetical protein IKS74_04295, partial [Methanomicrobium sp.]|nr:hypothetical protein [Methanomicrobium sp.]
VGMAMAPSTSSSQNSIMITFDSVQSAGTLVHIETAGGSEVLTYKPSKVYQSVVVSSPLIKTGETYVVYFGGSHGGTCTDGVYSGGSYSGGTKFAEVTVSDTVTYAGSSAGQFNAGGMPGMPGMSGGMPNGDGMNAGGRGNRMNGGNPMDGNAMNGNGMTGGGGGGNVNMMPPEMPDMPDMQGIPGMPGSQGSNQNMQNMPNMQNMQDMRNMPMPPDMNRNMNPYGNP